MIARDLFQSDQYQDQNRCDLEEREHRQRPDAVFDTNEIGDRESCTYGGNQTNAADMRGGPRPESTQVQDHRRDICRECAHAADVKQPTRAEAR